MAHTAMKDTAARGLCDMQGHVAASAGRISTPHPEQRGGVCVCDLRPPSQQVTGQLVSQRKKTPLIRITKISNLFGIVTSFFLLF